MSKKTKDLFGAFEDLPVYFSNTRLSRIENAEERGCSRCFPHGYETNNASWQKNKRNWKNERKTQYRPNGHPSFRTLEVEEDFCESSVPPGVPPGIEGWLSIES